MWTILKIFIEFVTILLLFYVLVFWPRGMWDLPSPTRGRTAPHALEGEVLTPGLPGKSPADFFLCDSRSQLTNAFTDVTNSCPAGSQKMTPIQPLLVQ